MSKLSNQHQNSAAAAEVRAILLAGASAALGTIDRRMGGPYVSLVTVASRADATPLLLLSSLAQHTQNIHANPRASLLFGADFAAADPLAMPRVTAIGTLTRTDDAADKALFLARHAAAVAYASFADFAFFQLHVEAAHFVGGFGRIITLSRDDVINS